METLLHLGCGGGHLDHTLKRSFQVTGVDLSEPMLDLARRLNLEVAYVWGDMQTLRLDRRFDAVMVADSIDNMLTPDDLRAAFATACVHLRPGGVFCTYAEATSERFEQSKVQCSAHSRDGVDIAFFENQYDPDPTDTTYESLFVYLIRRGGALEIETDRHLCGLFDLGTWLRLLEAVGFEVTLIDSPAEAPVFVGIRPTLPRENRPPA